MFNSNKTSFYKISEFEFKKIEIHESYLIFIDPMQGNWRDQSTDKCKQLCTINLVHFSLLSSLRSMLTALIVL